MVTQTIETPTADPAEAQTETEGLTPTEQVGVEVAAPEEVPAAAVPQVEVTEPPKPDYITREEWERERKDVADRAAADALEADRRRRQTENARKAQAEERAKARIAQTVDTVRATLVARGLDPEVATDESVVTAIDRVAQERAESLSGETLDSVDGAWDYLTGAVQELDDAFKPAAARIAPKLQHFVDTIRPQIEAKAREGYIAESELPKRVADEIARLNAKAREGQPELVRPAGAPATSSVMSWAEFKALPEATQLAMPDEQRKAIIAADAARRRQAQ